jgi:hypothetical protein
MKFEEMVGKSFGFYGVDNNFFKLGRNVFLAKEDESDGYRSYLETVEVVTDVEKLIFSSRALDTVVISKVENVFEGYELVGENGHVWLKVGTDHSDDYYPYFVFEYRPLARS